MFKPRFRPIDKSIDQAEAHFCYETNLSEAVTPSGVFIPMGSGYLFRFKGRLVNGANTDRLFFDSTNVGTGVRIILTHDFDRIKIKPYTGSTEITVQMPVGELPTDALFELTVYINIATGDYSCLLNNYLAKGTFTPSPSGEVKYTQITGGGSPNRYQGQIYEIDAIDMSPVQGRYVTNGDGIGGYIKTPPIDLPEDFLLSLNYTRRGGTSNEPILAGDYTSDVYMNHTVSTLSFWYLGVTYNFGYIVATGSTVGIKCGVSNGRVFGFIDGVQLIDEPVVPEILTNVEIWLLGAANFGAKSDDSVSNFKVYTDGVAQRFYAIDESSGDTVYDTVSGQNGTRVNMYASNFEYIPMNSQKWRFHDLQAIDGGVLKSITSDNEITISNYRPDGLKPA